MSFVTKAAQTPDVLFAIMKAMAKKKMFYHFTDYMASQHKPLRLGQISLKITNVCNLRCKMCGQWGESGYNHDKSMAELKDVVPLETYKRMVDEVKDDKPFIYIWGGEPFLYPDLVPLLRYMKEAGLMGSVVTNAVKLEKYAAELVDIGWDAFMVSLDGPKDIHNEIRGHKDSYDKVINGITRLNEEKRKQGKKKPYTMILTTVMRDNPHALFDVFKIAEEIEASCVVVYYCWFTTEERVKDHTRQMQTRFNITPWSVHGYVADWHNVNDRELQESVKRIKSHKWKMPYVFYPELEIEDIPRYYNEPGNFFGHDKCISIYTTAEVMPNGDVATCRDYPDYITGNIRENSIKEIFNNDKYWKFRNSIKNEGMLPICARCCGLMGF